MSHFLTQDHGSHSLVEWEAINREEGERAAADLRAVAPPGSNLSVVVRTDAPNGFDRTRVHASARLPLFELQSLIMALPLPGVDYELNSPLLPQG